MLNNIKYYLIVTINFSLGFLTFGIYILLLELLMDINKLNIITSSMTSWRAKSYVLAGLWISTDKPMRGISTNIPELRRNLFLQ